MSGRWVVCLMGLSACCTAASRADQFIVTNRAEWESLVGGVFAEETFLDASLLPGLSVDSGYGVIEGGLWKDAVAPVDPYKTRFDFDAPITAFGADWNLLDGFYGLSLLLDDSILVTPKIPGNFDGDFYGFVSDTPFSSVSILSRPPGEGNVLRGYELDNLVYSANFVGPVENPPATNLSTSAHVTSSTMTIDLFLGDPNAGGAFLETTGPGDLTGTIDVVAELDEAGNGYLEIRSANLSLENFGPSTVIVGSLGTIDVSLIDGLLDLESLRISVTNFQFSGSELAPIIFNVHEGLAMVTNPTGILAGLLPAEYTIDFGVLPLEAAADGASGIAIGTLGLDGDWLDLEVPSFSVEIAELFPGTSLYARIAVDLHAAAVPEVGSLFLALAGLSAAGGVLQWRRRKVAG